MVDCPQCGDSFKTDAGMKRHYGNVHDGSIAGVEVECSNCGGAIRKKRSHVEKFDEHFCDDSCQAEAWEGRYAGENHARYSLVKVPCSHCGSSLKRRASDVEECENLFCNSDCYAKWQSENRAGNDAPNWRGGYDGYYGPQWQKCREHRLEEDNHECVVCSMSNEEHKERYGWGLEVHHIQRVEKFRDESGELDYERANRIENLITMCRICHCRWEGIPVRPKRK